MSKKLYAVVTTHCNLHCPHCFIKDRKETFNKEKFMESLNSFDGNVILFGGEPTFYCDRLFDIIQGNTASNIVSISTNLTILNYGLIQFYKGLPSMATSWNPNRFDCEEYMIWKNNLLTLSMFDVMTAVMITLTDDLFDLGVDKFLQIANTWCMKAIKFIKFEMYVGETTPEYFKRADDFLCEVYEKWNLPVPNRIVDTIKDGLCYNCDEVYTLHPDGTITRGCPHGKTMCVPEECYSCEKSETCRPCRLQPYCSLPKRFSELIGGYHENV